MTIFYYFPTKFKIMKNLKLILLILLIFLAKAIIAKQSTYSKGCAITASRSVNLNNSSVPGSIDNPGFNIVFSSSSPSEISPNSCFAYFASPYFILVPKEMKDITEPMNWFNAYGAFQHTQMESNPYFMQNATLVNSNPNDNTTKISDILEANPFTFKFNIDLEFSFPDSTNNFLSLNDYNFADAFCNLYATIIWYKSYGQLTGFSDFQNYIKNKIGIDDSEKGSITINQGDYFKGYISISSNQPNTSKKFIPNHHLNVINKTSLNYNLFFIKNQKGQMTLELQNYPNFYSFLNSIHYKTNNSDIIQGAVLGSKSPFYYNSINFNCNNLTYRDDHSLSDEVATFQNNANTCNQTPSGAGTNSGLDFDYDASILCVEPQVYKSKN